MRTTLGLYNCVEQALFPGISQKAKPRFLSSHRPSNMNELSSSFEHAAKRPDPGSGLPAWRSWRPRNIHRPFKLNESILDSGHAAKRPPAINKPPYFSKSGNATQYQTPNQMSEGDIQRIKTNTQLPRAYKDTYTEFCGVYSPEKAAPIRDIQRMDSRYHCPRCDSRFSRRSGVKTHFSGCIYKHGNPLALKWNDHISLKQIHQAGAKDQARKDKFNRTLEAYSGIIIPSKLLPGEEIIKFVSSSKRGSSLCAICGGGPFWKATHVKSHFITCVKNHGNPEGANWYDRFAHRGMEIFSQESPDTVADAPPLA